MGMKKSNAKDTGMDKENRIAIKLKKEIFDKYEIRVDIALVNTTEACRRLYHPEL